MQPQKTSITNESYFSSLKEQIESTTVCSDLQKEADDLIASLNAAKKAISDQINSLLPTLDLLSGPGSIDGVVSWITNFIDAVLKPITIPYDVLTKQLAELEAKADELLAAIRDASLNIPDCNIKL